MRLGNVLLRNVMVFLYAHDFLFFLCKVHFVKEKLFHHDLHSGCVGMHFLINKWRLFMFNHTSSEYYGTQQKKMQTETSFLLVRRCLEASHSAVRFT